MFNEALKYWGSDEFPEYFKRAIQALELDQLPLFECCHHSGVIDQSSIDVMILSSSADMQALHLKIGVFFCEISSGCACRDDPSPAEIRENSYCELLVEIDRTDAAVKFTYASYAS